MVKLMDSLRRPLGVAIASAPGVKKMDLETRWIQVLDPTSD
jgi:hypothetical protein